MRYPHRVPGMRTEKSIALYRGNMEDLCEGVCIPVCARGIDTAGILGPD